MSHKPKPQEVSTPEALRQMRCTVNQVQKHKPSRKQIPVLLAAVEALIVLLQRQDLK